MKDTKNTIARPPALAAMILKIVTLGDSRFSILNEFSDEFYDIAEEHGPATARRWFWRQTLRSLPSISADSARWQSAMLQNYFKISLRNMRKRKSYTAINILGLALGMTCFIALMMYVNYELSYDSFHVKNDRIYRIVMHYEGWSYRGLHDFASSNGALVPTLIRDYPDVEYAVRTKPLSSSLKYEQASFVEDGLYADKDFFNIFTFPLIAGDPETSLENPFSIVLSRRLSQKLFGGEKAVGKALTGFDGNTFEVTGVFDEVPGNSHFDFDYLISFSSLISLRRDDVDNEWGILNYVNYVLLRDDVAPALFESKLTGIVEKYHASETAVRRYFLQPLTNIHLRTDISDYSPRKSDIKYLYLLSSIAIVILTIACVNYINLATSQASLRAMEVGIRKTAGATRPELIRQFLGESFLLTVLALAVSLVAIYQMHPFLSRLFEQDIPLSVVFNPVSIASLFGIMAVAGLLSGSYPACLLSSMKPASVMKGGFKAGRTGKWFQLRNVLVVFQFIVTIILITATVVIQRQLHYVRSTDLGYDRENVMTVHLWDRSGPETYEAIKAELLEDPNIIGASVSDKPPIKVSEMNRAIVENDDGDGTSALQQVCYFYVDHDFIDLYDIGISEGRSFLQDHPTDSQQGVIINETAARLLGLQNPLDRTFSGGGMDSGMIIGVVKDFHYSGLKNEIGPMAFLLNPERAKELSIRVTGIEIEKTIASINTIIGRHIDGFTFDYEFLADRYDALYSSDTRMGTILVTFSLIAIIIATIGLLGLISFIAAQKTKEIGIRKILGASASRIIFLLVKDFAILVVISGIVAVPASYLIMSRWLENFAYRSDISAWILLLSVLMTASLTAFAVTLQVARAARANPADSLRSE